MTHEIILFFMKYYTTKKFYPRIRRKQPLHNQR